MYDTSVCLPQSDCFLSAGYVENPSEDRTSYLQKQSWAKTLMALSQCSACTN